MTEPHHDSAAFLEVVELRENWYVRMICGCHFGRLVTIPLDTREEAERAIQAMDAVHRYILDNPLPAPIARQKSPPREHRYSRFDLRDRRNRLGLSTREVGALVGRHKSGIAKAELYGIGSMEMIAQIEAALSAAEAR